MPEVLTPGVLYVSEEFAVAGHLCACGCGKQGHERRSGPSDWSLRRMVNGGPTLRPSIGIWQLPASRIYWIAVRRGLNGAEKWTPEQIERGRRDEEDRLEGYFEARKAAKPGRLAALWLWLKALARRVFRRW